MTEAALRQNRGASTAVALNAAVVSELLTCDDRDFVHHAYQVLLGRDPDPTGAENYIEELSAGTPRVRILRELAASPEAMARGLSLPAEAAARNFQAGYAALSGASFLEYAYQTLLGREPDPTGLKTYMSELRKGAPRAEILSHLLQSAEYQERSRRTSRSPEARLVQINVRKFRLGRIPVIGPLLKRLFKCEGNSLRERRLRRIELALTDSAGWKQTL
jgi:hypothetical protein